MFITMRDIVIYVLEVMACSAALLALYRFCLERKKPFWLCRMTLIFSLLVSCVIPIMDIPVWESEPVNVEANERLAEAEAETPGPVEVYVSENVSEAIIPNPAPAAIDAEGVVRIIYWLGVVLLLSNVCIQLCHIWRLRRRAKVLQQRNPRIVRVAEEVSSFSFFGTIYLGKHSECEDAVMAHECSHIRHNHSFERLLMELQCAFLWWNPFAWWARHLLVEVHEYEADSDVIGKGYDKTQYMKSILESVIGYSPEVANGLRNSLTKKRFLMITSNSKSRCALLRVMALLSVVAVLVCTFSFSAKATQYVEQEVKIESGKKFNFLFTVVDSHNNPIEDAQIICGESGKVLYTNRDGHAILHDNISESFDIKKEGYLLSAAVLKPIGDNGFSDLMVLYKKPDSYFEKLFALANRKVETNNNNGNKRQVTVWDNDGQPLEGVMVKQRGNEKNYTTTDSEGRAQIDYPTKDIILEKEGYLSPSVSDEGDVVLCYMVKSPMYGDENALVKSMEWAKNAQAEFTDDDKYNVYVTVVDSDGKPMEDVTLVGTQSGESAITNNDGRAIFNDSFDDYYNAIKEGYSQRGIRLQAMSDGKSLSAIVTMYKDPNHKLKQELKEGKNNLPVRKLTQEQKDPLAEDYDVEKKAIDWANSQAAKADAVASQPVTEPASEDRNDKTQVENADTTYYWYWDLGLTKAPTYEGKSVDEMVIFVYESVKMPKKSIELGNSGTCSVMAVVETDGTLSILKDAVYIDEYMSRELKRVIKSLKGKWQPAEIDGKKVRSIIVFRADFYPDFSKERPNIVNEAVPTSFAQMRGDIVAAKYDGGDISALNAWIIENYKPYGELADRGFHGELDIVYAISEEGKIVLQSVTESPFADVLADQIIEFANTAPGNITPAMADGKPQMSVNRLKYNIIAKPKPRPQVVTTELALKTVSEPTFKGGGKNLFREYLKQNVRYPAEALKQGVTGRIVANFQLRKDEAIIHFDVPYNQLLADEVRRVIESSIEYWENGKMNDGKSYVHPSCVVIVDFCIDYDGKIHCQIDEKLKHYDNIKNIYVISPVAIVEKLKNKR